VPLRLPPDTDCSFCAYLSGERPYTILERDDDAALLVTFEPRGMGHVLAVPIEHRLTLLDLAPPEAAAVMRATLRAARAIRDAFDPDGIVVWQNNGVPAHQTVPHVHFHIAGTVPGGRIADGNVPRLSVSETDAIAARLRPHLPPTE